MLITSQEEADNILEKLSKHPAVAIDSEFQWTTTYHPIPALIQLGIDEEVYLIDPVKLEDFTSLKNFLENPECIKIFHACTQDVQLFNNMCNAVTSPIFDTQIGYAMLNTDHQISYRGMVEQITGELLSKGSQRSNWLRRPLSDTQLQYAKNDVIWLYKCYEKLQKRLIDLRRLVWHSSECSNYEAESFHLETEPQNLYKKMRGTGRLNRDQLSIMRELCAWREKVAKKVNLRPKRLLADESMFSIVYKQPRNTKDLKRCRDISKMTMRYNSRDIINCVEVGLALEEHQKPSLIEQRIPSKAEEKLCEKLFSMVNSLSEQLNIAAALLMTRQTCKKIAAWHFSDLPVDLSFLTHWRRELLEDEILKILK